MVERRVSELGPEHISTYKGMLKLALTLKRSTETDTLLEAKTLLQKCIQGFEAKEGENSENALSAMNSLAQVLSKLERDDEAEALFRRTLAGREEKLGKHHPVTSETGAC